MLEKGKIYTDVLSFLKEAEAGAHNTVLEGMVKASSASGMVAFAPSRSCDAWVDLPVELISGIEFVRLTPCLKVGEAPHAHPLVRITLKTGDNPAEKGLGTLLMTLQSIRTSEGDRKARAVFVQRHARGPANRGRRSQFRSARRRSRIYDEPVCPNGIGTCGGYNVEIDANCACDERPCDNDGEITCEYSDYCAETGCG
jgi:hypothetical protein